MQNMIILQEECKFEERKKVESILDELKLSDLKVMTFKHGKLNKMIVCKNEKEREKNMNMSFEEQNELIELLRKLSNDRVIANEKLIGEESVSKIAKELIIKIIEKY